MRVCEEKDQLGILIRAAFLKLEKLSLDILSPYGLSFSRYQVISYLYNVPPMSVRQVDLAQIFGTSTSAISCILQKLEKDGWISRAETSSDMRNKIVGLTEKAYELQHELELAGYNIEEAFTANLSPDERMAALDTLNKMLFGQEL